MGASVDNHILRLFCLEKRLNYPHILRKLLGSTSKLCGTAEGKQLQPQSDHELPGQLLHSRQGLGASLVHLLEDSQSMLHLPAKLSILAGPFYRAGPCHTLSGLPIFAFALDHFVHQLLLIMIFSLKRVLPGCRGSV